MSIARIATLATAAILLASAPSFAKTTPIQPRGEMVSQSVIDAGPQVPDNDWASSAQAELDYLHQVCPTVMSHPSTERANLVTFCNEYKG